MDYVGRFGDNFNPYGKTTSTRGRSPEEDVYAAGAVDVLLVLKPSVIHPSKCPPMTVQNH